MKLLPGSLLLTTLLFCAHPHASGQGPAPAPGWGSVWTEPANDQQRQHQELLRQIKAAHEAHDSKTEIGLCDRAIQQNPDDPALYGIRAAANGLLKRDDQALADLDRGQTIAEKRGSTDAVGGLLLLRAALHERMGRYAAAAGDLQAARKLFPNQPSPLNDLAWLRATAPDASVRDGGESVRLAKKALSLQREPSYAAIDTLAAAYAEAGDYPQAVASEKRAMAASEKEAKSAEARQKFQREAAARLRLFEQRQPYHAPPPAD